MLSETVDGIVERVRFQEFPEKVPWNREVLGISHKERERERVI